MVITLLNSFSGIKSKFKTLKVGQSRPCGSIGPRTGLTIQRSPVRIPRRAQKILSVNIGIRCPLPVPIPSHLGDPGGGILSQKKRYTPVDPLTKPQGLRGPHNKVLRRFRLFFTFISVSIFL